MKILVSNLMFAILDFATKFQCQVHYHLHILNYKNISTGRINTNTLINSKFCTYDQCIEYTDQN